MLALMFPVGIPLEVHIVCCILEITPSLLIDSIIQLAVVAGTSSLGLKVKGCTIVVCQAQIHASQDVTLLAGANDMVLETVLLQGRLGVHKEHRSFPGVVIG